MPPPPWGGTDYGCLLAAELNSSWMLFNVGTSGSLGFSFGGGGQQVGYYDWSMWQYTGPATCNAIANNTLPPMRCLWNAVSWGGTGMANTLPPGANAGNYAPELMVNAGEQYIICMSNWSYMTMNVTLDFFGTASVQCGLVLPIEQMDFQATAGIHDAVLEWTTATEQNSFAFEVERSSDGLDYILLGTVPAAGNSQSLLQYALVDDHPLLGLSYYRLTEYDMDGSQGARAVHFRDPEGGLHLITDPASDTRWVTIPPGEDGTLAVMDMEGRTVFQQKYAGNRERTVVGLSMSALPVGVYLIMAREPGRALSTRRLLAH